MSGVDGGDEGVGNRPFGRTAWAETERREMSRLGNLVLPPLKRSFSNPAFGLVYLSEGERNLGNLLKKFRDRYPCTKSVGADFW